MKEYIRLVQYGLGACLFCTLIGLIVIVVMAWEAFLTGWLWGMATMVLYVLFLGWHSLRLHSNSTKGIVWKARRQMMQRLLLILALLVIAMKVPGLALVAVVVAIVIMQLVMHITLFWQGIRNNNSKIQK